jgi:glutamyl-tRNA synthetase
MTQASSRPVRVRFAPSPTGFLHVGGARTALFNYLYAKKHGGSFILRIEDTDRARSTQEAVDAILEGMQWLGLTWDEGPFYQTQRYALYEEKLQTLLDSGLAYRCYCTPERLETMREDLRAQGKKPMYDRQCYALKDQKLDQPHTIRFFVPEGQTVIQDLVKGPVTVAHQEIEDLVIARADGTPTYNLVVVIDDALMEISHVIRGDDHLNNTPKQILLAQAMGFPVPQFAHLPLILGTDKQRLSKRHGATAVQMYRDMGYFPHALLNFLVRLGWSHKDQEIFTMEEMIEKFDFDAVGKAPGVFNPEKLLWVNQHYIRTASVEEVVKAISIFIDIPEARKNSEAMGKTIDSLRDRAKTLDELARMTSFYVHDEIERDEQMVQQWATPESKAHLEKFYETLQAHEGVLNHETIEIMVKQVMAEQDIKMKFLGMPLRTALAGSPYSPGIYELVEILGKERTLARLRSFMDQIN